MNLLFLILSAALLLLIIAGSIRSRRKAKVPDIPDRKAYSLLTKHVRFYNTLSKQDQNEFWQRCKDFLEKVKITPVGKVKVSALDRIYVSAAAIIPIFRHKGWAYNNLNEVLIYAGNFSKDFEQIPETSNVMGMVGDGAMHRTMILSIGALRTGFEQAGRSNTGIHEFVHLLDKADGSVDGIPEAMLPNELIKPWIDYVRSSIDEIRKGRSDINDYAATNEAEFLAVISEYFFQRPEDFEAKHLDLWNLLQVMYKNQPPKSD
jgi:Mlc titration factor MtfA (ptsG expression regulator)